MCWYLLINDFSVDFLHTGSNHGWHYWSVKGYDVVTTVLPALCQLLDIDQQTAHSGSSTNLQDWSYTLRAGCFLRIASCKKSTEADEKLTSAWLWFLAFVVNALNTYLLAALSCCPVMTAKLLRTVLKLARTLRREQDVNQTGPV